MLIATWNVNSIKAHLNSALEWCKDAVPDVLCLQETKCEDGNFPANAFEELGYTCALFGQKTYNGVAILSRLPIENIRKGLPGDDTDEQSRFVSATVLDGARAITVCCIYLPNGNPQPGPKFDYKINWMRRLKEHVSELMQHEEPLVVTGDYNVIPTPADARNPKAYVTDALFQPESRSMYAQLTSMGLTDAVRAANPLNSGLYSYWDYQAGAWQKNNGIRIDHVLLSPQAADLLQSTHIYKDVRGHEKPSDHVPVAVTLS